MLGQKGFGRETYLCTPRGTPGGIEGNYPYVVGGTLFEAIGQLIARSGHCFAVHHLASTRGGADKYTIPRSVRNRVPANRSEEHTSELQSTMRITYAVLCQ